jgi:opacity protein-like surface antigen
MSSPKSIARRTIRRLDGIALVMLVALTSAGSAQAWIDEDDEVFNRNGANFAFNVMVALETFSGLGGNETDKLPSGGLQTRFGYRFLPFLAVEAQFEWADGWELNDKDSGERTAIVDHFVTGTANVKGYLLQNFYQPYLLLGVGATHIRQLDAAKVGSSDTEFSLRAGAGIDLYVNEAFGLNLEYSFLQPFGELEDFPYQAISLGLFLRF